MELKALKVMKIIMNNQPRVITLINKKTQRRRVIHLETEKGKKTFMSTSAICKVWVKKNGFPIFVKVSYGVEKNVFNKWCKSINCMTCNDKKDIKYALTVFIKEYSEESENLD